MTTPVPPLPVTESRGLRLSFGMIAAFVAVDLLLVAACLLVFRQNVKLRDQVAVDQSLLILAKGTLVPPLIGEDLTGAHQTIEYGQDQRPTLVYTFSMQCPHCEQNWRAMHSLQALAPRRLRIVYIDTGHDTFTPAYLSTSGIGDSVVLAHLSPTTEDAYEARAVPQFLLVDRDGRVEWSHLGEFAPDDVSKALSLIDPQ
jgi:hypothetical protein